MKVWVAGDTGLLGQAVVRKALELGFDVAGASPSKASISLKGYSHQLLRYPEDVEILTAFLNDWKPSVIINASAYASIPFCEEHTADAANLNVEFPRRLALLAKEQKASFIHISSDQVFKGDSKVPYAEMDAVSPLNAYGRMKVQSEIAVLSEYPSALVVRTNIVGIRGRPEAPTFAEWLIEALSQRKPISLFDDYVTSSMHVDFLAKTLFQLVEKKASGLYHAASRDSLSKYDFGRTLAELCGFDFSAVVKTSMKNMNFTPPRPSQIRLDVSRIESFLGDRMPSVTDTLNRLAQQYRGSLKK